MTVLQSLSDELVAAVALAGRSVVRVDDGTRLTASGSVWNSDGIIVATSHGVESDDELFIETGDGQRFEATVLGRDSETDVAVLKASGGSWTPFGRSDKPVEVGSLVLAIGRPGEAGLQATFGILGSVGHEGAIIRSDAKVYPGFSGGALVDTQGRFAALLNMSFGRGGHGLGASIASHVVESVVAAVLEHGTVQRGYLGIGTQPVGLSAGTQQKLGRTQETALLIVSVEDGSPADKGGLLVGDAIVSLDGQTVAEPQQLRRSLGAHKSGDKVSLELVRAGQTTQVEIALGSRGQS